MSDPQGIRENAEREAADWFARLRTNAVSLDTMEAFRTWRDSPGNRSAYNAIEKQWRAMGSLEGEPEGDIAGAAALAGGARLRPARTSRAAWAGGAAIFGALILAAGGYAWWTQGLVSTTVGEQRSEQLADGSMVRLDTSSRIRVRFSRGERHIDLLQGQAFFDVAHDTSRPFVVQAGATSVRAVGTRFDVRRDGDQVKATLVEGVVQVRMQGGAAPSVWTLHPGQQIVTSRAPPQTRQVDTQAATSWTTGRVVFEGVPLTQAIAEVNRYSRHKITLDAPGVGAVPVTGVFDSGDTAAFVSAVCALHQLKADADVQGGVRLVREEQD